MIFGNLVALLAIFVSALSVAASPIPLPLERQVLERKGVQVVERLDELSSVKRAVIPSDEVVPVGKRRLAFGEDSDTEAPRAQRRALNTVSDNEPTMTGNNGDIVPFVNAGKRAEHSEATVEERSQPVKREVNRFPSQIASRSDGGEILPF